MTNEMSWLGMDSTQVLIIFLVVVFLVLIVFLLLYYYLIKGMKSKGPPSQSHVGHKSASGSMDGEKQRNIFANPERQLAVDQSTRMNTRSPSVETPATNNNTSEPDDQSNGVLGALAGIRDTMKVSTNTK